MVFIQLTEQLKSLSNLLLLLNNQQYNQKISHLGNASIGGHTRHIIELLKCLIAGYNNSKVDYINRQRNHLIETDRQLAMQELDLLTRQIIQPDKLMHVITDGDVVNVVNTSFYREIVYNTEHTIHHLALIKVALREMDLNITGENFGIAASTIKYLSTQNKIKTVN